MRSTFVVLHLSLLALTLAAECPWTATVASIFDDFASSVSLDAEKNRIIAGSIGSTNGLSNGFLTKLSPEGTTLWNTTFGAGNVSSFGGLDLDAETNDFAIGGSFYNEFLFGNDLLATFGTHTDGFVAKMNREGTALWARRFGTPDYDEATTDVAIDSNHNVVFAGVFAGVVNFGGIPLESKNWSYDLFIAQYNTHGSFVWSQNFGGSDRDEATAIAIDPQSNEIIITGTFRSADLVISDAIAHHGGTDVLVLKLNETGDLIWTQTFGGEGDDAFLDVAVDASHSIYLTGFVTSGIDFGTGPLTCVGRDILIAKMDADGAVVWTRTFAGSGNEEGRSLDVGSWLLLTGVFSSPVDFGLGVVTPQSTDFFVLKMSLDGDVVLVRTYENAGDEETSAIAYDAAHDEFVVTGTFSVTVNTRSASVTTLGGTDIFVLNDGFALPACSPSPSASPSASASPMLPSESASPTPIGSTTPSSVPSPTSSASTSPTATAGPSSLPTIDPIIKSPSASPSPSSIVIQSSHTDGSDKSTKSKRLAFICANVAAIMIVMITIGLILLLVGTAGATFFLVKKNIITRPPFLSA